MGERLPAPSQTELSILGNVPWPEATLMLIESDPRIFANDEISLFSYIHNRDIGGPRFFEPLAKYFERPDTSLEIRASIVEGCAAYLEKLKTKIANGEPFLINSKDEQASANARARLSFHVLAGRMKKAAPELVLPRLGPTTRELLDYCLAKGCEKYELLTGIAESAGMLDGRPWPEQQEYWIKLLDCPIICGIAFTHIRYLDPLNATLDAAIVALFCKQLRGEEKYISAFFLEQLAKARGDETVIAKTMMQIPSDLRPALIAELEKYNFSKPWVGLVPRPALTPQTSSATYKA